MRPAIPSRLNGAFKQVQLLHLVRFGETNKLVKDLSLGMKKKVALICALAVQPSVLILDEPTGGLDSDAQAELAEMLTQFISPSTMVICSTHDQTFLDSLPACRVISFPLEV